MPNLFTITSKREQADGRFTPGELFSVKYHDVFDFPLTISEMIRWRAGEKKAMEPGLTSVSFRSGYYFIDGKDGIVFKRLLRKRISAKKLEIARRASRLLSFLPSILMIAVTGSLAMENADSGSDIDLMVITKKGTLWTTRLFAYSLIRLFGMQTRKPNEKEQNDRLCLNIWLDESDLKWNKRNAYTAHEIAQIVPLLNKAKIYERFLQQNKWVLGYWPNAVRIQNSNVESQNYNSKVKIFEKLAFLVQYRHMRSKITRETVTSTRALFHPQDWGRVVLSRISS